MLTFSEDVKNARLVDVTFGVSFLHPFGCSSTCSFPLHFSKTDLQNLAAMLRSPATASILRSAVARRTLTSTAAVRTTHPAHSSGGQSVGGDMGDVKSKNAMVPVFMAIGAASVG